MWKLVCFSDWWECDFSSWVNSFGWSILVCRSLASGIPQDYCFHMQCARILSDKTAFWRSVIKKIPCAELFITSITFREKKQKAVHERDRPMWRSGFRRPCRQNLFHKHHFKLCVLCSKVLRTQHFQRKVPLQASLWIFRGLSCQTEEDTKRSIALDPLKSGIGFQQLKKTPETTLLTFL